MKNLIVCICASYLFLVCSAAAADDVTESPGVSDAPVVAVTPEKPLHNGSHVDDGEEVHVNYRNPFSYEPKAFVFIMIFLGAFLMMAFVCKCHCICPKLVLMKSLCSYFQWDLWFLRGKLCVQNMQTGSTLIRS